jgi:hypothetical protein
MYELEKIGKVFTSKFVGTGPSSYKKGIYRAAVSQKLRKTDLRHTGGHLENLFSSLDSSSATTNKQQSPLQLLLTNNNHLLNYY